MTLAYVQFQNDFGKDNEYEAEDDEHCTIRYILKTERAEDFDILAVLTSLNGLQIDLIDEIYYQV